MGRKRSTNTNLPDRMRARKRTRKNGKTTVYYFYDGRDENGRRKEIPLGTDYVAAVQEWSKLESAKLPRAARVTFPVAAARYLNTVISHRSSNTVSGAQKAVRKLSEFFGGNNPAPLDDIEPAHVRRYLDWRKDTPGSANNEITYLSAIFNYAREQGWTSKENPCRNVKKHNKKRREVYIEDYLYQAVYQAADQQMRDLMDIAYITGQRPIDIVGIHSSHIHDGILHINQQKTGAKLRFEISGKLKEIVDRIQPGNGYLFLNRHGRPLTRSSLSRQFLELRKSIMQQRPELSDELADFQFRDLRAKAATDIYLAADTRTAADQLGHASERMTKIYIRRGKILKPIK